MTSTKATPSEQRKKLLSILGTNAEQDEAEVVEEEEDEAEVEEYAKQLEKALSEPNVRILL
jgi:hypothetical protein